MKYLLGLGCDPCQQYREQNGAAERGSRGAQLAGHAAAPGAEPEAGSRQDFEGDEVTVQNQHRVRLEPDGLALESR